MGINEDIEIFEKQFGVKICICGIEQETVSSLEISAEHKIHSSPFCSLMKSTAKGLARCLECKKRANSRVSLGEGFGGYCAFGLWEYVMPLTIGKRVAGAVYVGGFHDGTRESEGLFKRGAKICLTDISKARSIMPQVENIDEKKNAACLVARAVVALTERELSTLPQPTGHSYSASVLEILRLADLSFPKTPSLEAIAKEMNRSAKHLGKCFKREVGISFSGYVCKSRLARAAELLIRTRLSVLEIALECGFESAEYFTRCFKHEYGMPPSLYRRNQIQK